MPFNKKKTHFGRSICIKKIKLQYIAHTCRIIHENISFDVFAYKDFIDFDLPKSMFEFINAEITQNKRERSERAKNSSIFICFCMSRVLSFLIKLDLFQVKIDVCVRYNRIFAYCVPTFCVLRTD